MEIDQIRRRFDRLVSTGVECRIREGATLASIRITEERLQVRFPEPVVEVWSAINGIEVTDPRLVIYPVEGFVMEAGRLVFAECDGGVRLAFDATMRNEAGQWSIVNAETGYLITYTLGSFYCTRIWTWLIKRRPIWFHIYPDIPPLP